MKIYPGVLRGEVTPPLSKSVLHRELICQAMCGSYPHIEDAAEDIAATQRALAALRENRKTVDCGESGSTLRFLLPVAAAMGRVGTTFTGSLRLLERPVPEGLPVEKTAAGWRICGALWSGNYVLDGSRTSQVTSGLLMALPLLEGDSVIRVENAVSSGYADMTASALCRYGIAVEKIENGYRIPGGQQYHAANMEKEADWSAAAWYAAANALGHKVDIKHISIESRQPDRAITNYIRCLPNCINISETPDIFPVLALIAALQPGKETHFAHCGFLRDKESDRLHNVYEILTRMGVEVRMTEDSLTICGREKLQGGAVIDSHGDHRMAFLAAFGALFCDSAVTLKDACCVRKSYPRFWEDYAALGGQIEE